jgi:hypothetical protein
MANDEVNLASAALAIALVALLTALGQLLGQYFSTADGFRKCQASVMGKYASKTRRVWRWREFRFETLYVIPEIFLSGDGAPFLESQILLTGSDISRNLSLVPLSEKKQEHEPQPPRAWAATKKVPTDNKVEHYTLAGVDSMKSFAATFKNTSDELACWVRDVGPLTVDALNFCREIGTEFSSWDYEDEQSTEEESWVITRDCRYLDKLQDITYRLTDVLVSMEYSYPQFRYIFLLGAHLKEGMFALGEETSIVRNLVNDYPKDIDGYFKNLPKIVDYMASMGVYDKQFVVDAWVTMMMRAFCWGAMHFFVPGERVPIQYFGSQLPVYIG